MFVKLLKILGNYLLLSNRCCIIFNCHTVKVYVVECRQSLTANISIDVLHAAVQTKQVLVTKQMGIYILHCLLRQ